MADYINRKDMRTVINTRLAAECFSRRLVDIFNDDMSRIPRADVRENVRGKNIAKDYDEVDQFICSNCGVEIMDWARVERDEDDGAPTYYEYRFNYCPNCGAYVRGVENG